MSRIVTPSSLKWLINKRARLKGQIDKIQKLTPIVETTAQTLEDARSKCQELEELHQYYLSLTVNKLPILLKRLEAIDIALDMHEIKINKDYIRPIRPTSKVVGFKSPDYHLKHGEITRGIYECLRIKGTSASTGEIALYIINKNGLGANRHELLPIFIDKVGSRLNALTFEGKVLRLHNPKIGKQGVWRLPLFG